MADAVIQTSEDILSMSDDDFLNQLPTMTSGSETTESEVTEVVEEPVVETPTESTEENQDEPKVEDTSAEVQTETETNEAVEDTSKVEEPKEQNPLDLTSPKVEGQEDKSKEAPKEELPKIESETVNYQQFHDKIMAPFKANGKMIQLRSPEEAIQLMQQGANYTRKMQDIQPYRKVLSLLEKFNLLDESKLSYLIDLDQKNPDAIKKLVTDAGIDPMDIDTNAPVEYNGNNHRITDEEVAFRSTVNEIASTEEGQATLSAVNAWDNVSQDFLWKNPNILTIIHEQRENGVYDTIVEEMDRQRLLGQLPVTTPFIKAYEEIGKQLAEQEQANNPSEVAPVVQQPQVVATTVAVPKVTVTNGDKASAAAPTRNTPSKKPAIINPLAMSDEDFMKQFPRTY